MLRFDLRKAVLAIVFAVFFGAVGASVALANQPHMVNARADLESALSQLNQATANKGGHRVNAINLINQAISEVNLGIAAAQ